MKMIQKMLLAVTMCSLLVTVLADQALAAYGNVNATSDVDPEVVKIKEKDFLGVKVADYRLVGKSGKEFTLKEFQAGKPMILAMSYYSCDGSCPVLNRNLKNTLSGIDDWKIGKDFKVLTVSFDEHDNPETLQKFLDYADFKEGLPEGWALTTLKDAADIKRLTDSIGFRFFWSPRDAMFLHPSVYVMLSPEGRVTRYLYGASISSEDMEISLTKALAGKSSEANVINFIVGACYSYNYEEGKYSINYPLFIALGALTLGLTMLAIGSVVLIRRRRRTSI